MYCHIYFIAILHPLVVRVYWFVLCADESQVEQMLQRGENCDTDVDTGCIDNDFQPGLPLFELTLL